MEINFNTFILYYPLTVQDQPILFIIALASEQEL